MIDPAQIVTRYAKSGPLNIAYQRFGAGSVNMVLIPGWASHVENIWTLPQFGDLVDKLAQFASVVILDRRGTGMSDPVVDPPTLEERMDDVRAVMDAVCWERAAIFGVSEGGPMAMLFAATFPDRVPALILYGTFARFARAEDYPFGYPAESYGNGSPRWNRLGAPVHRRGTSRRARPTTRSSCAILQGWSAWQ